MALMSMVRAAYIDFTGTRAIIPSSFISRFFLKGLDDIEDGSIGVGRDLSSMLNVLVIGV